MEFDLQRAADRYLHSDAVEWVEASQGLGARVSDYITRTQDLSASASAAVHDAVVSALVVPSTAASVVACRRSNTAKGCLVMAIQSALSELSIETEGIDWWGEGKIVDLGAGRAVHSWDGYEWIEGDRVASVVDKLEVSLADDELSSLIAGFLSSGKGIDLRGNLFALDTFDLALYHALETHPDLLRCLDWRVFEQMLADILSALGYEVELQRGTKDGGVDIFAVSRDGHFGPQRYILQAKRWTNRVGVEPVRELLFLQHHLGATKSCLATTSLFTKGAWRLADQYKWQLSLRDYFGIREWVEEAASIKRKGQK